MVKTEKPRRRYFFGEWGDAKIDTVNGRNRQMTDRSMPVDYTFLKLSHN
jgi:hypothetical protein